MKQDKPKLEPGRDRQYSGIAAKLINYFCASVVLYALIFVSGLLDRVNLYIDGGVHRSIILTFTLVMVFLLIPATGRAPRDRLPWYDAIFILLTLISGGYLILNITRIENSFLPASTLEQVLALIAVGVVVESARRSIGWIIAVLGLIFFLYPFYAQFLSGVLHMSAFTLRRVTTSAYLDSSIGVNGSMMQIMATIIVSFIAFGVLLQYSGIGKVIIDLAMGMLGRFRGGPAKASVLASGFLGSVVASGAANVATIGVITIPLMKSIGYKPYFAGGVEAAASVGGMIMPPVMGAAAFIMAEWLGITYLDVCKAAFFPAILYYIALLFSVDFEAGKAGLHGLARQQLPSLKRALREGWFLLTPVAVLVFFLVGLHYRPQSAAIFALVSIIPISFLGKKENHIGFKRFFEALNQAGRTSLEVGAAFIVSGLLTNTLELTGIGTKISGQLVNLAEGNMILLVVVVALLAIVLGLGVGAIGVYITLALMAAPALITAGAQPLAAHMFIFYLSIAAPITPPVATSAFVAAAIAGAGFQRTGWEACKLAIVVFVVPFFFIYSPQLLMSGSRGECLMQMVSATIGVWFLCGGVTGHVFRNLRWWQRSILIIGGIMMISPIWVGRLGGLMANTFVLLYEVRAILVGRAKLAERGHG